MPSRIVSRLLLCPNSHIWREEIELTRGSSRAFQPAAVSDRALFFALCDRSDANDNVEGGITMSDYAHPEVLVSTQWVAEHSDDPELDSSDRSGRGYLGLRSRPHRRSCRLELANAVAGQHPPRPDRQGRARNLLGQSGISNDTTIVLYGDNNNWFAAYAFWQLKYYGHKDVRLMNGGRKKWLEEKRPLINRRAQGDPHHLSCRRTRRIPARAQGACLLSAIGKAQGQLVDVRSVDEFTGKIIAPPGMNETAQRAGHIPRRREHSLVASRE